MRRLQISLICCALVGLLTGCALQGKPEPQLLPGVPAPQLTRRYTLVAPSTLQTDRAYQPWQVELPRYQEHTVLQPPAAADYGATYPYIGSFNDWYWEFLYGFCDAEGRIISDPYYTEMQVLEQGEDWLYLACRYTGYDENYNYLAEYLLLTPDGSWVGSYEGLIYQAYIDNDQYELHMPYDSPSFGRGTRYLDYLTVCRDGLWGLVDYQGREIWPCRYEHPLYFSEGLVALRSQDGLSYSYHNLAGELVLGPYALPQNYQRYPESNYVSVWLAETEGLQFIEGRARIVQDGLMGFLDQQGQVLVEPQYAYVSNYIGGAAYGQTPEDDYVLLDAQGREYFRERQLNHYVHYYGDGIFMFGGEEGGYLRASEDGDWSSLNWEVDGYQIRFDREGWRYLVSRDGVTQIAPGDYGLEYWRDGVFFLWHRYDSCPMLWHFEDGVLFEDTAYWTQELGRNLGFLHYETGLLRDYRGNLISEEDFIFARFFGDRIAVAREDAVGLLDMTGTWLLRIPLSPYPQD